MPAVPVLLRPGAAAARRSHWLVAFVLLAHLAAGCGGNGKASGTAADSTKSVADSAAQSTAAIGCGGEGEEGEGGEGGTRKPREQVATVNAARVSRGELIVPVIAEGTIRARHSGQIRAEIGGRIQRLAVQEGQAVRQGQTLAVLDGREYRIAIEEARSRYLKALGVIAVEEKTVTGSTDPEALERALAELEKQEAEGKVTREERRGREIELGVQALRDGSYRRELVEARSGLAEARAAEERARLNLDRTIIRAPFAGVVTKLDLTAGQLLSLGETICTLVDNVDLEAEVGVLESDVGGLAVGRPALLIVPALDETLRVQVDVVSPNIDSASRTCRVLLRVRNPEGRLQPGMFVRASIAGKIFPDRLLVPLEAILTRDGRPLLFRLEGDQAKWVYVQLGQRNDRSVEVERVLQGGPLDEGTLVVVSDHLTLSHDAKVKVRRVVDVAVAWSASAEE